MENITQKARVYFILLIFLFINLSCGEEELKNPLDPKSKDYVEPQVVFLWGNDFFEAGQEIQIGQLPIYIKARKKYANFRQQFKYKIIDSYDNIIRGWSDWYEEERDIEIYFDNGSYFIYVETKYFEFPENLAREYYIKLNLQTPLENKFYFSKLFNQRSLNDTFSVSVFSKIKDFKSCYLEIKFNPQKLAFLGIDYNPQNLMFPKNYFNNILLPTYTASKIQEANSKGEIDVNYALMTLNQYNPQNYSGEFEAFKIIFKAKESGDSFIVFDSYEAYNEYEVKLTYVSAGYPAKVVVE